MLYEIRMLERKQAAEFVKNLKLISNEKLEKIVAMYK